MRKAKQGKTLSVTKTDVYAGLTEGLNTDNLATATSIQQRYIEAERCVTELRAGALINGKFKHERKKLRCESWINIQWETPDNYGDNKRIRGDD